MMSLYYRDLSVLENLGLWRWRIKGFFEQFYPVRTGGMGCACGWQCPDEYRFRNNYWRHTWWDEHVQVCPLDRDESGTLVGWPNYQEAQGL